LLQKGKELDLANEIEAEVNRRMLDIANQQGINSIEKLYEAMRQSGLVPEDVRRTMRTEMMKQAVLQNEVDRRVYLGFSSEEVKKYFDAHPDKFRKPLKRELRNWSRSFARVLISEELPPPIPSVRRTASGRRRRIKATSASLTFRICAKIWVLH
jgi:hypothetical protein